MPSCLHSNRSACFISTEVKNLNPHGIASRRATPCNLRGNKQFECFNGTLQNLSGGDNWANFCIHHSEMLYAVRKNVYAHQAVIE